jgi:hypothetical protein
MLGLLVLLLFCCTVLSYYSRWLRCLLCEEFNVEDTIVIWDSILACISKEHLKNTYSYESLKDLMEIERDPLYFMEFVCVAMIGFMESHSMY